MTKHAKEADNSWIELLAQASASAEYICDGDSSETTTSPDSNDGTITVVPESRQPLSPPISTDSDINSPPEQRPPFVLTSTRALSGSHLKPPPKFAFPSGAPGKDGASRKAAMLRYDDLERIVTGFNEAEARGNVSSFSPRPAHVTESNIGSIYAEGPGYSRRRSYRYEKCQTWKSSGGRIGSTNLDNGLTNSKLRIFLRKYGKVMSHARSDTRIALRFHKYVEIDPVTQLERGPNIYYIPPSKREQIQKSRVTGASKINGNSATSKTTGFVNLKGPVLIGKHQKMESDAKQPLLQLHSKSANQSFVNFLHNDEMRGDISTAPDGGLVMSSSSGDFAEWHEQQNPDEVLTEGDVVGFRDGKIGLSTEDCNIFGVISSRPVVLGSVPKDKNTKCAIVAYCGRVPVRVFGPVKSGDVLVPSGHHDGVASVLSNAPKDLSFPDCDSPCNKKWDACSIPITAATGAIAVALESTSFKGVTLVESVVTPPAMTKEVLLSLNGRTRAQTSRRFYNTGCVMIMLLLSCLLTGYVYQNQNENEYKATKRLAPPMLQSSPTQPTSRRFATPWPTKMGREAKLDELTTRQPTSATSSPATAAEDALSEQPGQSVTLLPHEAVAHADGVAHANTVRVTEHSSVDSSLAMQQALASPYSIPPDPDFAITPDDISRGIHKGDVAASEYSKVAVVEATSQNFTALKMNAASSPLQLVSAEMIEKMTNNRYCNRTGLMMSSVGPLKDACASTRVSGHGGCTHDEGTGKFYCCDSFGRRCDENQTATDMQFDDVLLCSKRCGTTYVQWDAASKIGKALADPASAANVLKGFGRLFGIRG